MGTYKNTKGEYKTYGEVDSSSIDWRSDLQSVTDKCQELANQYGLSLSDFDIEGYTDYDSASWRITYERPATDAEIKIYEAEQNRYKQARKDHYERLKKEFETDV